MNKILLYREQFLQKFKDFFRSTVFDEEGVLESPNYLNYFLKKIQNASILMIPTAFNSGKLYVQEPTNRNEDFDVIRNSTVPRFNQDGNWEEVPVNTPCIDYSTGEPLLLTQPQSTNLIQYSEDFSLGWWAKSSSTVSFDSVTNPKGELGVYRLIPDNGIGGNRSLTKAFTSLTELHTLSVYAKYGGYRYFFLRIRNAPSAVSVFDFETETLSILGVTISAKLTKLKDGWFRVEATFDPSLQDVVGQLNISFSMSDLPNAGSFDGDGSRFTYIWGAQFEQQPSATSYIFTDGNVATRLGDTIQNAGSTDTINSEEGVLYLEGVAINKIGSKRIVLIDNNSNYQVLLIFNNLNLGKVSALIMVNGVFVYNQNTEISTSLLSKIAFVWSSEKVSLYVNEVEYDVKEGVTIPPNTLNKFSLDNGQSSANFFGKTKELRVYKTQEDANKDLPYIIPFDGDFLQSYKDFINEIRNIGGITEKKTYTDNLLKQAVNASIVNVPTSYGVGKLFNQSPSNRLEDFDVIRNSNVFRRAPNGLLEEIGANVPCIDYATGEPLLLTQPQSTNLINYSEDFTQWGGVNGILTSNATESPTGDLNAAEIQNASVGTVAVYQRNLGVVNAGNNTYSIYVKYKDGDIRFNLRTGGTGSSASIFTISENGVTLVSSIRRTKIEDVGNGWFRISVDFDTDGISNINAQLRGDTNGTTNAFYIWGAQVEGQPSATSYIPTNGSVATRLADQVINAGSVDTINSQEGVLYFEGAALTNVDGVTDRIVSLSDGTADNRLFIRYDSQSNRVEFFYRKDGINAAIINTINVQVLEVNSFTLVYNSTKIYAYLNDVLINDVNITGNSYPQDTLNKLSFDSGTGSFPLYGKTKELRVYKSIAQAQIDLPYIT